MGKFDRILDKLQQSASDRDADTAKHKCPLKKKPAIYVAVLRGDTGDPVSGIKVEISKPTNKSASTNGDGEAKTDPAKSGAHTIKLALTNEQRKKFALPPPVTTTATKGQTSVHFFLLEPLPTLRVEVKDLDGKKPLDGVRVRAGLLPELTTSGGKADFAEIAAGKYRINLTVANPLETKVEVFAHGASLHVFEPGYALTWEVDLAYGDAKSFQVTVARVRTVEFVLAEDGTDRPIEGARIYAKLPGGGKSTVVTDQTGTARVTFAQDGKVEIERIEVEQPGSVLKVKTR
jgi:hypothetical protein